MDFAVDKTVYTLEWVKARELAVGQLVG